MSAIDRRREPSPVPAFRAEVQAFPDEERDGRGVAFAMAVAEAAMLAAKHLDEEGIDEAEFEVSRIQIRVARNPGPTSYKVTITPTGG